MTRRISFLLITLSACFHLQAQDKPAVELKKAAPLQLNTPSNAAYPASSPVGVQQPAFMQVLDSLPLTEVIWEMDAYDFGEIREGTLARHIFSFENTGEHPLKIVHVKPSCGCTTPNWTQEYVMPGEKGFVEVQFDSRGRLGSQRKNITVILNTESKRKVLSFKGEVVKGSEG